MNAMISLASALGPAALAFFAGPFVLGAEGFASLAAAVALFWRGGAAFILAVFRLLVLCTAVVTLLGGLMVTGVEAATGDRPGSWLLFLLGSWIPLLLSWVYLKLARYRELAWKRLSASPGAKGGLHLAFIPWAGLALWLIPVLMLLNFLRKGWE